MTTSTWPKPLLILVEVREPLPPIEDGEPMTLLTDDVAFSGFYRGVLTEESDD